MAYLCVLLFLDECASRPTTEISCNIIIQLAQSKGFFFKYSRCIKFVLKFFCRLSLFAVMKSTLVLRAVLQYIVAYHQSQIHTISKPDHGRNCSSSDFNVFSSADAHVVVQHGILYKCGPGLSDFAFVRFCA